MRLSSTQLRSPGPLMLSRTPAPPAPPAVVEWPFWDDARKKIVMQRIPASRIPAGWQSVKITAQQRPGTCEEAECRLFINGWTAVLVEGDLHALAGDVSADAAAQVFGYSGPASLPPTVKYHEPGMPCPFPHKVSADLPPFYMVNGSPKSWNEFEDAFAGGIYRTQQLIKEGRF